MCAVIRNTRAHQLKENVCSLHAHTHTHTPIIKGKKAMYLKGVHTWEGLEGGKATNDVIILRSQKCLNWT